MCNICGKDNGGVVNLVCKKCRFVNWVCGPCRGKYNPISKEGKMNNIYLCEMCLRDEKLKEILNEKIN